MSVQNFSFLALLEVAEKFVVGWGGVVGWWSRPSLGFSFSQAEQYSNCHGDICPGNISPGFLCPYKGYLSCYLHSEERESRSCLGLETKGTETLVLVSVLY